MTCPSVCPNNLIPDPLYALRPYVVRTILSRLNKYGRTWLCVLSTQLWPLWTAKYPGNWNCLYMGLKCSSICKPSVRVNGRRYKVVKDLGEGGKNQDKN